MKTTFILKFAAALAFGSAAVGVEAQSIFLSTSETDPFGGTTLDLAVGDTSTLYVWVDPTNAGTINGLDLDILSDTPEVLEGVSFEVFNPNLAGALFRWTGTGTGDIGDLVLGSNSVSASPADFGDYLGALGPALEQGTVVEGNFLHAALVFTATAEGQALITPQASSRGISSVSDSSIAEAFSFGTATVTVPEPTASVLLALTGLGVMARRHRGKAR
ncbi:MAG: PEP-CTERM sorting domain-containing protein [Planctomycetota bacterium]